MHGYFGNSDNRLLLLIFLMGMIGSCRPWSAFGQTEALTVENAFSVLDEADVRTELDLSDEQLEELSSVLESTRRSLLILRMRSGRALDDEDQLRDLEEQQAELADQAAQQLKDTLLGWQYKRLMELSRQKAAALFITTAGLLKEDIAEEFEISEEQKDKLKKLELQMEEKLKQFHQDQIRQIEELLEHRDKQVEKILGSEKSMKFAAYFGKPFFLYLERFIAFRRWEVHEGGRRQKPDPSIQRSRPIIRKRD